MAKRRASMSPVELDLLEYSQAMASGNAVPLLESVQELLRRDSSSRLVNNLGDAAWRGNRPGAAERVLRTWPESLVPPTMTSYLINACHVFHELGDFRAQRAIAVRWAARTKSLSPIACQLEADFALGDMAHANHIIDSLTAIADPTAAPYATWRTPPPSSGRMGTKRRRRHWLSRACGDTARGRASLPFPRCLA